MLLITKKKFKEFASIHVYGKGKSRTIALFFDWKNDFDNNAVGYKYMIKGYGGTQKQLLDDAYNMLVLDDYSNQCWYDLKIAKTEQERFKVPLIM